MYCPPDYVDQETLQRLSPESWHNEATEIQELINLKAQGSNTLQELQKKSEMIPKITSTQSMVNLVGKGKLSRVLQVCRSSRPEVFLGNAALKVCSKFIIFRFK